MLVPEGAAYFKVVDKDNLVLNFDTGVCKVKNLTFEDKEFVDGTTYSYSLNGEKKKENIIGVKGVNTIDAGEDSVYAPTTILIQGYKNNEPITFGEKIIKPVIYDGNNIVTVESKNSVSFDEPEINDDIALG